MGLSYRPVVRQTGRKMAEPTRAWPMALAALAVLTSATTAHATVFSVVHSTPDEVTVLDPSTVETLETGLRRGWSVSIKKTLGAGGPPQPGYIRTLNEYDCGQRRIRWLSLAIYSRFGVQLLKQDNPSRDWKPAPRFGESDDGVRVVCDGVDNGGAVSAPSVSKLVIGLMQTWDEAAPLPPLQTPHSDGPPIKAKKKSPAKAKSRPKAKTR
jgi:hypothetical protein